MLKKIEDSTFICGVLFFATLFLGIIFRVVGLADTSAWGDEVASWYYSQNLSQVISFESHTPVYYFLCRLWTTVFPETILSLRYFSIVSGLIIILLSSYFVMKKTGKSLALLLFATWWLWPTMIIFSRQARHYGLYADLTLLILVIWGLRVELKKWYLWGLLAFYQSLHPLAVIPSFFLFFRDFYVQRNIRKFLFEASSVLPVSLYYAYRFLIQGQEKVMSNIAWIDNDSSTFLKSLMLLFAGDSYPFSLFYPVTQTGFFFLLLSLVLIFYVRKSFITNLKKSFPLNFVSIFVVTILFVELSAHVVGINFRISRYFIFLLPFFIFYLTLIASLWSLKEIQIKTLLVVISLTTYVVVFQKPWGYYVWDDQIVESLKGNLREKSESKELVICASGFQLKYYFNRPYSNCSEEAFKNYYLNKDFYFFDLNGNDKFLVLSLIEKMKVDEYKRYGHGVFLSLTQKKDLK